MSDRLAEIGRRIATVRQLGGVVNAMRGIAGARGQQARALLPAIRAYAETTANAIAQARRVDAKWTAPARRSEQDRPSAIILFGAEQGFAGAFPERMLDAIIDEKDGVHIFLVGTRSGTIAAERGLPVHWQASHPSRAEFLPMLATSIIDALYDFLAEAGPVAVTMVFPVWTTDRTVSIQRRSLLPLDPGEFRSGDERNAPLVNLPPDALMAQLAQEYVFAGLCEAAAECFAAENEARMMTMAAAKSSIDGTLSSLELEERLTRQEEITAEVVELAGGAGVRKGRS